MNKSILIIDTPESCSKCPFFNGYYSDMTCRANGFGINYPYPDTFRQKWCPLRPVPEKSLTGNSDYLQWGDWEDGYNACIDEILGDNV